MSNSLFLPRELFLQLHDLRALDELRAPRSLSSSPSGGVFVPEQDQVDLYLPLNPSSPHRPVVRSNVLELATW